MASQGASLQNYNNELVKCESPPTPPARHTLSCCRAASTGQHSVRCWLLGASPVRRAAGSQLCLLLLVSDVLAGVSGCCMRPPRVGICCRRLPASFLVCRESCQRSLTAQHVFRRHRGSEREARGGESPDPARRGRKAEDPERSAHPHRKVCK
jgi:hypothetical protein